jgi:hypothetical protein
MDCRPDVFGASVQPKSRGLYTCTSSAKNAENRVVSFDITHGPMGRCRLSCGVLGEQLGLSQSPRSLQLGYFPSDHVRRRSTDELFTLCMGIAAIDNVLH